MSLGALDFGLLVDGSVVMVEHLFHRLRFRYQAAGPGWQQSVRRAAEEVAQAGAVLRADHPFGLCAGAKPGRRRGQDVPPDGRYGGAGAV
jgi:hypothetical protein